VSKETELRVRASAFSRVAAAAGAFTLTAQAENWPQWRGPLLNGATNEKGLPDRWSKTENVVWAAKMPDLGASTPIVWDDHVFVTAMERESKTMWALCLKRRNGKVRWKRKMGRGFFIRRGNTGATPTPVTDGERVYFLFGTGRFAAFDFDGKVVWDRDLVRDHGEWKIGFRYGASPLLFRDRLYVSVIHSHEKAKPKPGQPKPASYLLCVDPATGEDLWKQERDTNAIGEAKQAYTTPCPIESEGGPQIALIGADHATGHDPKSGAELWRSHDYNPDQEKWFRNVASPVSLGELLFVPSPRGNYLFALRPSGSGALSEDCVVWRTNANAPDVCVPLVMAGRLYVLDGRKRTMACFKPQSGELLWREKLRARRPIQASPTGADGRIYCVSLSGEVVVLAAGDTFKELAFVDLDEYPTRSTIAIAQGQIFIRTGQGLYCIGK